MKLRTAFCLAALLAAALPPPAAADEILDEIEEAVRLYEEGDHAEAAAGLEYAAMRIRQLRAGRIADALPDPLPGWEAGDAETSAVGGSVMGGATGAERRYEKDGAAVDVQILGDAPMLQAAVMMLKNPMMLSASGRELVRVAGRKASLEYDGGDRRGEIQLVVGDSVLVTVTGRGVDRTDLEAYAGAVDFALIESLSGD